MSVIENEFGTSSEARLTSLSRLRDELTVGTPIVNDPSEPAADGDEALIIDDRSALSPAQVVENKLSRMLKDSSLPVSHLQTRGLIRTR